MSQDESNSIPISEPKNLRGSIDQVKMIAQGGMAQIFRARQPSLERFIAIKKLRDELLSHSETVERFRREAKVLASVLHQNVCHVYDFVETPNESFILMEYIEGIDVSTAVQKVGHLPPEIAAGILLGVAKGVSYIHTHHLIHRDIKPSNIRLTTRGEVKLMDFGIVMELENKSLTRPGMMVGSPSYLSPEQVLGDPLAPTADVFLLGITLYEMLTGTKPFRDEANETVFQRIREAKYIPAREMNKALPRQLDAIVSKCLQKKVEDRYQTVKDLISDLERYLGPKLSVSTEDLILKYLDEEALVTPTVPYSQTETGRDFFLNYLSWKWVVAGTMLLLLAGGLGYWLGSKRIPPTPSAAPSIFIRK